MRELANIDLKCAGHHISNLQVPNDSLASNCLAIGKLAKYLPILNVFFCISKQLISIGHTGNETLLVARKWSVSVLPVVCEESLERGLSESKSESKHQVWYIQPQEASLQNITSKFQNFHEFEKIFISRKYPVKRRRY